MYVYIDNNDNNDNSSNHSSSNHNCNNDGNEVHRQPFRLQLRGSAPRHHLPLRAPVRDQAMKTVRLS